MDLELSLRRRSTRGFTLVEVIVALGLMAMGMLAIAPLFVNGMHGNATGQDLSVLNSLAKEQLEQILQYNFLDPRLAVPTGATVTLVDGSGATTTPSGQLYRNQNPLTETIGGVTASFPYELVYVVQDYNLDSNNRPDFTTAVDDGNATWNTQNGVKVITVYAASKRTMGMGEFTKGSTVYTNASGYNRGGVLSTAASGRQIRISAVKAP